MSSPLLASVPESHATRGCCVPTRRAITMQRRHQSGLHCELGSVPQSETVNDDLDSALIEAVERAEVQIANKSVRAHLPPCIPVRQRAQAGNPLVPNTPALEHGARWLPCTSRRRPHRQVRVDSGSERKRSTQPHAKWLCVESGRSVGRQGCQCRRCAIGPH